MCVPPSCCQLSSALPFRPQALSVDHLLSQDCAELICRELGSDLGRFACVSTNTHRITDEASVWRDTYQVRASPLWRVHPACSLRGSAFDRAGDYAPWKLALRATSTPTPRSAASLITAPSSLTRVEAPTLTPNAPVSQARFDDMEDEWGRDNAMPDSLWRACMVRQSGPKAM